MYVGAKGWSRRRAQYEMGDEEVIASARYAKSLGKVLRVAFNTLPASDEIPLLLAKAGKFVITSYSIHYTKLYESVSGPLDIRGDHSDIMLAMNTGWIVLMASDVQAVYDMNIMAPRIGEEMSVRLPVMVAFDGFFTSHQKRRVEIFSDRQVVEDFLGPFVPTVTSVDPRKPVTIGPYMNDPDLINNKKQQSDAIIRSHAVSYNFV